MVVFLVFSALAAAVGAAYPFSRAMQAAPVPSLFYCTSVLSIHMVFLLVSQRLDLCNSEAGESTAQEIGFKERPPLVVITLNFIRKKIGRCCNICPFLLHLVLSRFDTVRRDELQKDIKGTVNGNKTLGTMSERSGMRQGRSLAAKFLRPCHDSPWYEVRVLSVLSCGGV